MAKKKKDIFAADWLDLPFKKAIAFHKQMLNGCNSMEETEQMVAYLAERDMFFLMYYVLNRGDIMHPWIFDRFREFQASPDGHLDLWSRDHYKSSCITFCGTVFEIIRNPEITIGLFSHTKGIARAFLTQIKQEFEGNRKLHKLWPHIFYADPKREAPNWSVSEGIVVKRKSNPKERTIEAWGLVDGQPTSKHYQLRIYDDVVTLESVSTPEQIQKTTNGWEMSNNLGTRNGRERYIGTRYHLFDTYAEMIKRESVKVRIHAATDDGTEEGKPVLLTAKQLKEKRKKQGVYNFACQMLQNPVANSAMGFREAWINTADVSMDVAKATMNIYLLCDPASGKNKTQRKDPDYTSMWVIGVGPDENRYLLDGVRDRLNLTGRAKALIRLHRKWRPKATGYEEYGMQADIEHIEFQQSLETYRFPITVLSGNKLSKEDRIKKLVPVFEDGRFYMPKALHYMTEEGTMIDLVKTFTEEEFVAFPVCAHDDMLDCMARIEDPELGVITPDPDQEVEKDEYDAYDLDSEPNDFDWALA